jgi:hypothetical protein
MSRMITRSGRAQIENEMVNALAAINGKIVVKVKNMIIVEFNHRYPGVAFSFVETIPFKRLSDGKIKVIYSDMRTYNKKYYFRERYGNDTELIKKIKNYLG